MGGGWRKAVHIFSTIKFLKDTIFTLRRISIAMPDINHPAEDVLAIRRTSILNWNFLAHRVALPKYFNLVGFTLHFLHGNNLLLCIFNVLSIERSNSCCPLLLKFRPRLIF